MSEQYVDTPVGRAAVAWYEARSQCRVAGRLSHREIARRAGGHRPVLSAARSGQSVRIARDRTAHADRAGRPGPVRHTGSIPAITADRAFGGDTVANHTFGVPARSGSPALPKVTGAVTAWLDDLLGPSVFSRCGG
jgi:hypothetical protein